MLIGVPREVVPGERRVALVPESVAKFVKAGTNVIVERGAGDSAAFPDAAYEKAGATIADAAGVFARADLIAKVARPTTDELRRMRAGQALVAFLAPLGDPASVDAYAKAGITALSMDAIPRTTRAQSMDALSSQANIAGYKAVLLAAAVSPRFFPMLTTAAGTIRPQRAFILGAGVAGLQAIATARRLGALVSAFDTRPVVKEQVMSLGATFVELDMGEVDGAGAGGYANALSADQETRQQEKLAEYIAGIDIVITTAAVPGRKAPVLVTEAAVRGMKPGSVIVDLAAEGGGNCELTQAGKIVERHGVTIVGTTNLPSTMPTDASTLYSRNVFALLALVVKDGAFAPNYEDEIVAGTTLTRDGTIVHEPTTKALAGSNA